MFLFVWLQENIKTILFNLKFIFVNLYQLLTWTNKYKVKSCSIQYLDWYIFAQKGDFNFYLFLVTYVNIKNNNRINFIW